MRILNRTKDAVIAAHAETARTFSEKVTGLLGATVPRAVIFKTRWGIHTIGMKFSIDCMVCDSRGRVRTLRANLPPGRFFMWNPFWGTLVELPAGTLRATGTEAGDEIEFSETV